MAAPDGDPRADHDREGEPLLHRLVRTRAAASARALLDDPGDVPAALLPALRAWRDLALDSATDVDVPDAAARALALADGALRSPGRAALDEAAERASLALEILFHRDLHSDRADTPLVHDTTAFLRPLHESRVGALLTGAPGPGDAGTATVTPPGEPTAGAPSVAVVTGPFGRFHEPVVAALRASGARVGTVRPADTLTGMTNLGVDAALVRCRLLSATGALEPGSDPGRDPGPLLAGVADADVVVADWAGKATALLSWLLPQAGPRLVVRVHSVDLLRAWLHLIDWSRVHTLVCVAGHIAGLARDLLGARLEGTRVVVLPNTIDTDRFAPSPSPAGSPGDTQDEASRTLSMVGWAQPVKDPLWALELLALLRRDDDRWRLRLIGADFADDTTRNRDYAQVFRARSLQPDVREGIEYVGYTRDLPPLLARSGYAVCASVREGHPVGLLESVAAGAVPVIREWPMFADRGAARALYGGWVVNSVEDAARRVLALATPAERERAAAQARGELLPDAARAARDWSAVVRGRSSDGVAVSATTPGPAIPR